jgi:hypothetical protein
MFILVDYEPTHRVCNKCYELKTVDNYRKRRMGGFGFGSVCKSCVAKENAIRRPKYYQKYKDKPRDLTKEQALELFEYSDGNLIRKKVTIPKMKVGEVAGFINKTTGYVSVKIYGKAYKVHQIVYLMHHGFIPKEIDHINGNRADNRIENLREVTRTQNRMNSKMPKTNTSGIKNVHWKKQHKKWEVILIINGKRKDFGRYADLELAELVAIEARNKYHGKYANHGLGEK